MNRGKVKTELGIILALTISVYLLAGHYELLERVVSYSRQHEHWQLDEFLIVFIFLVFAMAMFAFLRWRDVGRSEQNLAQRNAELQQALADIRQLKGIIPICAACKSVRCDEGFWHRVEVYISEHSAAEFSHGICPECLERLYPELVRESPNNPHGGSR